MRDSTAFDQWVGDRDLPLLVTNNGSQPVPFQSWHRFKEAFSPELIRQVLVLEESHARACIDPFGGSGTTALAAQFLGVRATTIEVNPFLADVIRAKLARYDVDALADAVLRIEATPSDAEAITRFEHLPATFIERSDASRWLFDRQVAVELASVLNAIDDLPGHDHRRLFRVLIGGLLADVSNVVVSGKGRRFRRRWSENRRDPALVRTLFLARASTALADVHRFADRSNVDVTVIEGDARAVCFPSGHDLAVFSPPYPNSFDYTDVYNLELWMLGYLTHSDANRTLRTSTMSSHVQLARDFASPPKGSDKLDLTLAALRDIRPQLWSRWIPEMVGAYFADLVSVLGNLRRALAPTAPAYIVVGDSSYGGVTIRVADVLEQLAGHRDWDVRSNEPLRAMRRSGQQGAGRELAETLLVLTAPES